MNFHEQRDKALRLLEQSGIDHSTYAPPLMQLLWRCGVKVRPPHFMGFGANALLSGVWFGASWGLVMWVGFWLRQGNGAGLAVGSACSAGLLFGLFIASYYTRQSKKYRLPSWESLGPN